MFLEYVYLDAPQSLLLSLFEALFAAFFTYLEDYREAQVGIDERYPA